MLDGVIKAGAIIRDADMPRTPAPTELDALAEGARSLRLRKVPDDALVHASVDVYLRSHPDYWRRLPVAHRLDRLDWVARAERLLDARDSAGAEGNGRRIRRTRRGGVVTQTHCTHGQIGVCDYSLFVSAKE